NMPNMDLRSTCLWKLFCRITFCSLLTLMANPLRLTTAIHCVAQSDLFLVTKIWKRLICGKVPSGCVRLNLCHVIGADFGNKPVITTVRMYGKKKGLDKKMGRDFFSTHFCFTE